MGGCQLIEKLLVEAVQAFSAIEGRTDSSIQFRGTQLMGGKVAMDNLWYAPNPRRIITAVSDPVQLLDESKGTRHFGCRRQQRNQPQLTGCQHCLHTQEVA